MMWPLYLPESGLHSFPHDDYGMFFSNLCHQCFSKPIKRSTAPSMPPTAKPISKPKPNASRSSLNSIRSTHHSFRRKNPNAAGVDRVPKYQYKR